MNLTVKKTVSVIFTTLICIFLIIDAKGVGESIRTSISSCIAVIIPSLFAFMVLSSFIINSGIYKILFNPLHKICRHFIRLDIEHFSIFMLSLFGGYPVGIKLLCDKNTNNTEIDRKAVCFCYCSSPAFAVSIVGTQLFNCTEAGIAVYLSNAVSCIIIAIFLTRKEKLPETDTNNSLNISLESFTEAVYSSGKSLYIICMMILCFNVFLRLFTVLGITPMLEKQFGNIFVILLKSSFEISNICSLPTGLSALLPFMAAIFSFGGLCIIMQAAAINRKHLPLKGFILARIPAAVLSAIICHVTMRFIDFSALSDNTFLVSYSSAYNPSGSLFLLVMTILMLKILLKAEKKV